MRPVYKVDDLRPEKIFHIPDRVWTLIPFKVGPLCLHTLIPPILLPLETPLEVFFWNGIHFHCRVPHYLFSTLKTGSFQWRLQFWKQPEVTSSHVWLFPKLKTPLKGSRFESKEEIMRKRQRRWTPFQKKTSRDVSSGGLIGGISVCKHQGPTLKEIRVQTPSGMWIIFSGLRSDTFYTLGYIQCNHS